MSTPFVPDAPDGFTAALAGVEVREYEYDGQAERTPVLFFDNDQHLVCFGTVLKNQLRKLKPRPGETIRVEYKGKVKGASDKTYKDWALECPGRPKPTEVDWDAALGAEESVGPDIPTDVPPAPAGTATAQDEIPFAPSTI